MKHNKICFSIVLVLVHILVSLEEVGAEFEDESWMQPSIWTENIECCKCPESSAPSANGLDENKDTCKFTEDGVALLHLRRWLSNLFDRKKFTYDDKLQTYKRTITLSLSSKQLERIEKLNDPRDLDEIITEILAKAKNGREGQCSTQKETRFIALVVDIFIDLLQLTKINEIRFLMIAVLVIAGAWFLHRKYKISYFTQAAVALFVFGYIYTYIECNRELELKEMNEILQLTEEKRQSGLMSYLSSFFSSSNSKGDKHNQLLKKSTKIKLGFCRPDHVAIMYFNDMFMKYVEVMVQQCLGTLGTLQDSLPFPMNWLAVIILFSFMGFLVKLTFQYILSPGAWSSRWPSNNTQHYNAAGALTQGNVPGIDSAADRVSGDNLKTLLTIISATAESNKTKNLLPVSGVQEISGAIESVPENDTSTSSATSNTDVSTTSTPSKVQNNNDSPDKKVNTKYNDVQVEDLSEDT